MAIDVVWSEWCTCLDGIVPRAGATVVTRCLRVGRLPAGRIEVQGDRTHPLRPRAGITSDGAGEGAVAIFPGLAY